MQSTDLETKKPSRIQRTGMPVWLAGILPFFALALLVWLFAASNPLAIFRLNLPPIEQLQFERIRVVEDGFEAVLVNGGPDPVTVAQVLVDDAYRQFSILPDATIERLGRATLHIPYPWVENEPHEILAVSATGMVFAGEVAVATLTPKPGIKEFQAYGLLGIYVGVIPVGLGMLWFPFMRALGRRWLGAILALTVGLLVFLLVDTLLEAFEFAAELPGVFQGVPLALFAALLTWLGLMALGAQQSKRESSRRLTPGLYLATLIAISIGLHNLGEGLAVGAAFAAGEAALGSFLVIGFMLHNITEGIGIAAPLVPSAKGSEPVAARPPALWVFVVLTLLAGLPAVLGAWMGGFLFSPVLATLFLGIGLGAIWQVIVEVTLLLKRYAERDGTSLFTWLNLLGFLAGLAIMYLTAFLVKF